MKIAKLKKLMLETKAARSAARQAVGNISPRVREAKSKFERSKQDLKSARKSHKAARKQFRKLQKDLAAAQSDQTRTDKSFAKLEKKWKKLAKETPPPVKVAGRKRHPKPPARAKRPPQKSALKVVPSAEVVATS